MKKIVLKLRLKLDSSDSESIEDEDSEDGCDEGMNAYKTEMHGKRRVEERSSSLEDRIVPTTVR